SNSTPSTGAQITAVVVYENLRALTHTSRHLIFDCQLYGVPCRSLVIANLRYFNRDGMSFSNETGVMVVRADITQCGPDAPLELLSSQSEEQDDGMSLSQTDFEFIGDIKWVIPLKSIDSFDFNKLHPPMISVNGIVLSAQNQIEDPTLDEKGKVAVFEMEPTQYTSYYARTLDPKTLPVKAFFRLSSKRYEHGAPVPWPGRIVHVDGFLHDVVRDASGLMKCVIAVEDIDSLASGTLPRSARAGITQQGSSGMIYCICPSHDLVFDPGSHKRKFAFDP
ncbi:hypothetical protein C8Q76DRAFT_567172, partial [Earliella scabrosa]